MPPGRAIEKPLKLPLLHSFCKLGLGVHSDGNETLPSALEAPVIYAWCVATMTCSGDQSVPLIFVRKIIYYTVKASASLRAIVDTTREQIF
jgi:hypothetical protein